MTRLTLTTAIALLALGCTDRTPPQITKGRLAFEGVYATPGEISGFSGTTLELKDGGFRYWFYRDIGGLDEPEYSITGKYELQDGKVLLRDPQVNQRQWFVDVVNGTPVLWREDALETWKRDQKIYDYGVLVWTGNEIPNDDPYKLERRSVRNLYSAEKKKEIKAWKDPFVDGPQ